MKCIYCDDELLEGEVQIYESLSLIRKLHPATIRFKPNDKKHKVKKSSSYANDTHGYYCKKCNRIIADFVAEPDLM